jgi:hypothetical protein
MKKPYLGNIGPRFGRLTAIEYVGVRPSGSIWRFKCDCGGTHEASMSTVSRKHAPVRSCGCLKKEISDNAYAGTPTHNSWLNLRDRCNNPKGDSYRHYGGRGIKVCERWNSSFPAFLADMGERPEGVSIDRIDVNGNYRISGRQSNVRF